MTLEQEYHSLSRFEARLNTERNDTELIQATLSGDKHAFTALVRRYERSVAASVTGMLGRGEDAEEVGQQVFIRFYEALAHFRGESSVKTYLTRIAINLSLNELQRRKRNEQRHRSLDNDLNTAYQLVSDDAPHDSAYDHALVEQALMRLSDEMREVVVLRLVSGYSTEETAEILRIPVGTVLSRLSIARKKLREMLSPYFRDEYDNF
jgi:RNA polymerase sigma-70 factor, ECF subfamily